MPATKKCDKCAGDGTVPREPEKREDGEAVPLGLRQRELCPKCGGSGVIPENYAGAQEKAAGFIADQIG